MHFTHFPSIGISCKTVTEYCSQYTSVATLWDWLYSPTHHDLKDSSKFCVLILYLIPCLYVYHNLCNDWQVFFLISFTIVMCGGTLWHLHRFLQCIKYIKHEFTSSTILLHLPLRIPEGVSVGTIFSFTYKCTTSCIIFTLPAPPTNDSHTLWAVIAPPSCSPIL
jgi:hypothetical protein